MKKVQRRQRHRKKRVLFIVPRRERREEGESKRVVGSRVEFLRINVDNLSVFISLLLIVDAGRQVKRKNKTRKQSKVTIIKGERTMEAKKSKTPH